MTNFGYFYHELLKLTRGVCRDFSSATRQYMYRTVADNLCLKFAFILMNELTK